MPGKKNDRLEQAKYSSDELSAREKLLTSLDQLTQVLDILGKLTQRIHHQVEAMPDAAEQTATDISSSKKTEKEVSIH